MQEASKILQHRQIISCIHAKLQRQCQMHIACSINLIEHMQLILQNTQIKTNGDCTLSSIRLPGNCSCQCNRQRVWPPTRFVMLEGLDFCDQKLCSWLVSCPLTRGTVVAQKLPTGCFDCCLMPTTAHGRHTTMCNCCIKASVHRIRLFSITMKSCTESYKLRSETILRLANFGFVVWAESKGVAWLPCNRVGCDAPQRHSLLATLSVPSWCFQ